MTAAGLWFGALLVPSRRSRAMAPSVNVRETDCTGAVRCALAGGEAFSSLGLRDCLGRRWSQREIGSVLCKLMKRGAVEKLPPEPGRRCSRYRWARALQ